LKVTCASV
jgi:hypothetical protein